MLLIIYSLITYRIVVTVVTVVTMKPLAKVSEDIGSYSSVTVVTFLFFPAKFLTLVYGKGS